ncbi:MAG: histidine phosphotransferase family protein [Alphaproteobacteria bacterium]
MSGSEKQLSLRVVELLNSRLCHDLISPVGAVKSGLELLAEFSDDPGGEAMALITSSADSASRKLQFFRVAFGSAGAAQAMSHAEAVDLCSAMVVTKRTQLNWPVSANVTTAAQMKLALNLVVLTAEALPRGGEIRVSLGNGDAGSGDGSLIEVVAAAADAKLADEVKAAALGEASEDDLTPRSVQAYLVHLLVERSGGALKIDEEAGESIHFKVLNTKP